MLFLCEIYNIGTSLRYVCVFKIVYYRGWIEKNKSDVILCLAGNKSMAFLLLNYINIYSLQHTYESKSEYIFVINCGMNNDTAH